MVVVSECWSQELWQQHSAILFPDAPVVVFVAFVVCCWYCCCFKCLPPSLICLCISLLAPFVLPMHTLSLCAFGGVYMYHLRMISSGFEEEQASHHHNYGFFLLIYVQESFSGQLHVWSQNIVFITIAKSFHLCGKILDFFGSCMSFTLNVLLFCGIFLFGRLWIGTWDSSARSGIGRGHWIPDPRAAHESGIPPGLPIQSWAPVEARGLRPSP